MAADEQSASRPERPASGDQHDDAWRPDWDPQRLTAAELGEPPAADYARGRAGPSRAGISSAVLVLVLLVAAAVVLIGTGDGGGGGTSAPSSPPVASPSPAVSAGARPDPIALAAARRVIDEVNTEAGASPARQRSVLERVVDPTQLANQRGCAAASTTVRLLPAWSDVRVATDGHLIVPSLIRIFTGGRITGTDVAIIDVTISAGQAALPALCVS